MRIFAAVGKFERHLETPVRRPLQRLRIGFVTQFQPLVVGDAENHLNRIGLRHRGEQDLRARHQRTFRFQGAAAYPVDRRFDARPFQIEAGFLQARPGGEPLGVRNGFTGKRIVVILAAYGLGFDQLGQARDIAHGLRMPRLGGGHFGLAASQRVGERRRINRKQRLPGAHLGALGEIALEEDAGDPGAHLDFTRPPGLCRVFEREWQSFGLHGLHRHRHRPTEHPVPAVGL